MSWRCPRDSLEGTRGLGLRGLPVPQRGRGRGSAVGPLAAATWGPLGRGRSAVCRARPPLRHPRTDPLPSEGCLWEVDGSGLLGPPGTAPKDRSGSRSPGRTRLSSARSCPPRSGSRGRPSRKLPSRKPSRDALSHLAPSPVPRGPSLAISRQEDVSRGRRRRRQSSDSPVHAAGARRVSAACARSLSR